MTTRPLCLRVTIFTLCLLGLTLLSYCRYYVYIVLIYLHAVTCYFYQIYVDQDSVLTT